MCYKIIFGIVRVNIDEFLSLRYLKPQEDRLTFPNVLPAVQLGRHFSERVISVGIVFQLILLI